MKHRLYMLIACVWFMLALPGAACLAQAVPVLSEIASVLINANTELDRVDVVVQDFFRLTNADDATRARYAKVKTNVLRGINVAGGALRGTQDLSQEQYDAAFKEYVAAWQELEAFLTDTGALNASGLRAGPESEPLPMPKPHALSFKVE